MAEVWRFFAHEDDFADIDEVGACERLGRVLSFPTVSSMDAEAVDWQPFDDLRVYMQQAWPRVFAAGEVELIDHSLLVTLSGSDPALKPVMLMGHMDVVPVVPGTEADWTHAPFSGHVDDTYIWGRGAIDMKDQVAGILEAVEYALTHGWEHERTLLLAFGQDEETTQHGAGAIGRVLEERGIAIDPGLDARARSRAAEAHSIVWFADERRALAVAAVSDRLREGSREAVAELRRRGIEVHMLTGDQEASAAAVARAAGITRVKAGVLPGEKEAYIRDLQRGGHVVAMAGDGINDSAALARSDVGIALGSGSDIAIESADIVLMRSDLEDVPRALRLSALTLRDIKQNLFWAFIYNLIGVPVAAGVLYPLTRFLLNSMLVGAAIARSSVSVVANSLQMSTKPI